MLNLAGTSFDFGNVLFAVLQECEHQRRALLPKEAEARLREIAARKLGEIRASYEEAGGLPAYWQTLEREVMEASLPQYIAHAIEQTRLEQSNYDLWRRGDPASRAILGLAGLVIGGLIWKAPFIPIFEEAIAFVLAGAGFFYPEIKRLISEARHTRFLNRLVTSAERYQKNRRIHAYSTQTELEEAMRALDGGRSPAIGAKAPDGGHAPSAHPDQAAPVGPDPARPTGRRHPGRHA